MINFDIFTVDTQFDSYGIDKYDYNEHVGILVEFICETNYAFCRFCCWIIDYPTVPFNLSSINEINHITHTYHDRP